MGPLRQHAKHEQRLLALVERHIDSLSAGQLWTLVIAGIIAIAALDYGFHAFRLAFAPLYMLPMCLASWRLGLLPALCTAVAAAVLPSGVVIWSHHDVATATVAANVVLHTLVLMLVASIVSSYRHSHDREAKLARVDAMTGVLNKQAFERQAGVILRSAKSDGRWLLLLYIDLDAFKSINDRHGHEAGDIILKSFANTAAGWVRRCDRVGRIGGDEFAAILITETMEEARDRARTAHSCFSSALADGPHPTTCSIGALIVPADCKHDLATLWCESDRLMYAAKRAGRNSVQVEIASGGQGGFPPSPVPEASEPDMLANLNAA